MEDQVVTSSIDIALYAPIIIAMVEAVKQAVPVKFGGIVTIGVALLAGVGVALISPIDILQGISSALLAVGAITYKRAGN